MTVKCIVKGCKSVHKPGGSLAFSRLPWKNAQLCKQWLLRAGIKEEKLRNVNLMQYKNSRMCSLHFEGDQARRTSLLPTLHLPEYEKRQAASALLEIGQTVQSQLDQVLSKNETSQELVSTTEAGVSTTTDAGVSTTTDAGISTTEDAGLLSSQPLVSPTSSLQPRLSPTQTGVPSPQPLVQTRESTSPAQPSTSQTQTSTAEEGTLLWQQIETPVVQGKFLKRKLFSSSTQVTPKVQKLSYRSKAVQQTPPLQKSTQMTPKQKTSVKSSTDLKMSTSSQTEAPPNLFILKSDKSCQTPNIAKSNKSVQASISRIEEIKSSDKELKKFTGIEDYNLFGIVHKYLVSNCLGSDCRIDSHCSDPGKVFSHISTEDQLLLVLYKLKRNPIDSLIASEFKIATGRVSEIFKYWICRMYCKFKVIKIWPSNEKIMDHMPVSTKQTFPDLAAISDCVEFSTQVPRGPIASKQLFSHYKNCHTVKAMYTTAPNGALIHCSDFYGGNASDKEIFAQSDLAKRLQPGQGLMVDKGFLIKDLVQGKNIKLYRPPFLCEKSKQFQSDDRDSGRLIARSRITVENFNARLGTFAFLKQKKIPVLNLPIMNEIGFVCGFLANLGPLIRSSGFNVTNAASESVETQNDNNESAIIQTE